MLIIKATTMRIPTDKTVHISKLLYEGDYGISLIKSTKTLTKKTLLEKYDVRIILTGTK